MSFIFELDRYAKRGTGCQESHGCADNIGSVYDRLKELEDFINDVNDTIVKDAEAPNVDDVLQDVDKSIAEDQLEELNMLQIPTSVSQEEEKEPAEKEPALVDE